jgi:hypothetical protein
MIEWVLPIRGISKSMIVDKESPTTSGYINNVRPRDVLEKRIRLGQRPGLDKWSTTQVGGAELPVVAMTVVSVLS